MAALQDIHPQLPLALHLREGMDFSSFVTPPGGDVVVERLRTMAAGDQGGQAWLHGAQGSGRTHLLEATVHAAGAGASLLPAAELSGLSPEVLDGMESLRLLALDDVDELAGRPEWEEALFHVYNRCLESGTILLFSAGGAPVESGFALADLVSRFSAGPVFRLPRLDDAGLAELFRLRARRRGLNPGEDVARYLVSRCQRSPSELVALLDRLDGQALIRGRRLTIPFVKEELGW